MDALERYIQKRQRPIYFRLKMSPDDRQRLAMLASALKTSQAEAIRRLIEAEAEAQGVKLDAGQPGKAQGVER